MIEILYGREAEFLIDTEWARSADDILWRGTKLGLCFGQSEVENLERYVAPRSSTQPVIQPKVGPGGLPDGMPIDFQAPAFSECDSTRLTEERIQRHLAAILAADAVNYSRLMEPDETATLAARKKHRAELFDPTIAAHNGRIVKLVGDGKSGSPSRSATWRCYRRASSRRPTSVNGRLFARIRAHVHKPFREP